LAILRILADKQDWATTHPSASMEEENNHFLEILSNLQIEFRDAKEGDTFEFLQLNVIDPEDPNQTHALTRELERLNKNFLKCVDKRSEDKFAHCSDGSCFALLEFFLYGEGIYIPNMVNELSKATQRILME